MAHRINERNIGNSKLDATPKTKGQKLNLDEYSVLRLIIEKVYNAMEENEITGTYTDGSRLTLSLTGEQMFDFFEIKRKLNSQFLNQKLIIKK
jgi:hypothetical protein